MERKEKQKLERKWAEKIANKYGIFPSTVLQIKNTFTGRLSRNGRYMTQRQRTEEFFNLYFEGRKNE